eukprot:TRINITY_DN12694_c0_g1_i1.p1 TRINITY_DN12694_c0_g1~~TRINITY_DN12694_c0_g1_i1.p1  ORF type:complete len:683 (+),score=129.30 TRINITY_DN12694_c0_g1_i1:137-2185(+)
MSGQTQDNCTLKVTLLQDSNLDDDSLLHVSLVPPEEGNRKPASFVCVVDVSGSMESSTAPANPGESSFTRISLVVHSLRAFAATLLNEDEVSLVTFDHKTTVQMDRKRMDDHNRKEFIRLLENLSGGGSTDMIGGLSKGVRLACKTSDRPTILILLTDGMADRRPNNGWIEMIKSVVKEEGFDSLPAVIHTFGYGYNVESNNLYEIAQFGGGVFSFIPDSTMVGTAIVNVMSSSGAVFHPKTSVIIESSTDIKSIEGYNYTQTNPKQATIDLGLVQFGQSRDLIARLRWNTEPVTVSAVLSTNPKNGQVLVATVQSLETDVERTKDTIVELARSRLVKFLRQVPKKNISRLQLQKENELVRAFIQKLFADSVAKDDERLEALLSDIHNDDNDNVGQIGKALSQEDWYNKWGYTYLLSLLSALEQQQCHNFKDKSVQRFGGALFSELQDKAQTAFCTLPPPEPVKVSAHSYSSSSYSASAANNTPVNMAGYMNACGGCFDGNGLVQVAKNTQEAFSSQNGETQIFLKRVDLIKKGDVLLIEGKEATVRCVVLTSYPRGADVVILNGLKLTPFHPVFFGNSWQFPALIPGLRIEPFDGNVLFDFVLENEHAAIINGVKCVTLAHGRNDDEVLKHDYFGTEKVIEELSKVRGWSDGRVVVPKLVRDPLSKLVVGLDLPLHSSISA